MNELKPCNSFFERVCGSIFWMQLSVFRRLTATFIHFHNDILWPKEMKDVLVQCCTVIPNFVTEQEEASLLDEINPHMKRMRYEKSHWDDVMLSFFFEFQIYQFFGSNLQLNYNLILNFKSHKFYLCTLKFLIPQVLIKLNLIHNSAYFLFLNFLALGISSLLPIF